VAELRLLPPNLEQACDYAFARVDIAAVDDVAPASCRKRGSRTEECPFGTINKSLKVREIQEIGADFLYFANFQAFVDRAEWAFFRPAAPFPTTRRRDIVYRGNIDPGERVIASLLQVRWEETELGHWYRLERAQDNFAIADIFTLRRL